MIGIIDYGVGNLRNVEQAIARAGYQAFISSDISALAKAGALILPGVGAFGDAVAKLNGSGARPLLDKWAASGKPVLGICVGMQMLYEKSYEFGEHEGLGYLKGSITPFGQGSLKVPHIGWNQLVVIGDCPILKGVEDKSYAYFVHSFYAKADSPDVAAYTEYGVKAAACVNKGSLYGVQFHPEKSSKTGAKILSNFLELSL
ncbi:MAG: imidazole glycerol phosphate synthase subunit HisH [Eubacteriaceae bacterium]|nr:imidazole glycerol phosphate synthase subunit HisH [Eubacteriaceae bacterium]